MKEEGRRWKRNVLQISQKMLEDSKVAILGHTRFGGPETP